MKTGAIFPFVESISRLVDGYLMMVYSISISVNLTVDLSLLRILILLSPFNQKNYPSENLPVGNFYDFAFGLNWSGVLADERVSKYKRVK